MNLNHRTSQNAFFISENAASPQLTITIGTSNSIAKQHDCKVKKIT